MTLRAVVALLALLTPLAAESTQAVLARLDKEAASFRQMIAKVTKDSYTAVLNDTSRESGAVWMKRSGRKVEMRTEIAQPEPRSIGLADSRGEIYYPKIQTVQIYDLSRYRGLMDQFLLLGFGSSGSELAKSYSIKAAGEDLVAGRKSTRLELIPKSREVLEQFSKFELWIPLDGGYPVQQRLLQPGGDYYLVTYTDVKLNPNLPDEMFRLQLPPGVKKEYPQKQ